MKNVFSLSTGDCNLYRHSHRYTFAIKANDSLENIKKAYLNSVSLSKVTFTKHIEGDEYSPVGLNDSNGNYLEYTVFPVAAKKLIAFGLNPYDKKYMYDAVDEYDIESGDDVIYLFDDDNTFVDMLMDFIKISLPHLEYSILSVTDKKKDSLPTFNDVDGGKLYDIGYMFEFENCYIFDR